MKHCLTFVVLVIILALSSCEKEVKSGNQGSSYNSTYPAIYKDYFFRGVVMEQGEFPVSGVSVTIEGPLPFEALTNGSGQFSIMTQEIFGKWNFSLGEEVSFYVRDTSTQELMTSKEIPYAMLIEDDTIKVVIDL